MVHVLLQNFIKWEISRISITTNVEHSHRNSSAQDELFSLCMLSFFEKKVQERGHIMWNIPQTLPRLPVRVRSQIWSFSLPLNVSLQKGANPASAVGARSIQPGSSAVASKFTCPIVHEKIKEKWISLELSNPSLQDLHWATLKSYTYGTDKRD